MSICGAIAEAQLGVETPDLTEIPPYNYSQKKAVNKKDNSPSQWPSVPLHINIVINEAKHGTIVLASSGL